MPSADTVSTYKSSFSIVDGKLKVARKYTQEGIDPYIQVDWVEGTAKISSADGKVVFEQQGVEFPSTWSQTAINIVASKYFYGKLGTSEREYSLKQLISRVVNWYRAQGVVQNYFTPEESKVFADELTHILLHQIASFNSPVWFNVGIQEKPQVSACFINSVEDTMESIIGLQVTENRIFKSGSGAGSNLSKLRASTEFIEGGGKSSGPVSFMKGYDAWASVTKSGGKTRRAAKMQILDVDHPDIMEFIRCKIEEEKKAKALIDAGYDASVGGEAYDSVFFQNSNLSIRVTDKFMQAVTDDAEWLTTNRKDGSPNKTYKAREILREAARCAWLCGDPGIQYHDTINKWHTMPKDGEQVGTNPCQPGWATVLTPEGIRTFDQIDIGSAIWSGQQWTKITKKVNTGVKPVFAFRTMHGTFYGTEDHSVFQHNHRIKAKLATYIDIARAPSDLDDGTYRTNKVLCIDSMGKTQVFDITVDAPEHTYWTDGLLVSNCSEYTWLDDTSCNLASLNLLKFRNPDSSFRVDEFTHAVEIMFVAQDISVAVAGYPTEKISKQTKKYRTIGLGYTNLGAYLMASGLPYDSHEGRVVAAAITSLMTARAAATSGLLAKVLNPLETYDVNRQYFANVIDQHADSNINLYNGEFEFIWSILGAAYSSWKQAKEYALNAGFRNAQFTLLAPTGTIGLAMDCVTTGIEPELGLTKYKNLVGGGVIKTVNSIISVSLGSLGYSDKDCQVITEYVDRHGTVEGAPGIQFEHVSVFDCSFKSPEGTRSINPSGHTKMMAAVQPFLSGAISKTVNIPEGATIEDIEKVYIDSHKLGIKCLAVYRDGCKGSQPLDFGNKEKKEEVMSQQEQIGMQKPLRRKLPDERNSITHKFTVGGFEGYVTVGLYADGSPGEVFVTASKEGSTVSGLMDSLATMMSISLQYGVPLEAILPKLSHSRFEPSGFTENPKIRMSSSIVDYLVRWLSLKFLLNPKGNAGVVESDAPPCANCGSITIRAGTCYKCNNCGDTTGCG